MNQDKSRFGRVSSVFIDTDKNEVFVNVLTGPNREPRKMKVSTPQTGMWSVPTEGDIVEVHTVGGTRVARNPTRPPSEFSIPADLGEGDFCFRLNANTELRFSHQSDGTVNVDITADGDVTINSAGTTTVDGGNVVVGDGANAVSVAVQDHTHDYTWTDAAGSGTTSTPNEAGTSSTVE